MAPQPFYQDRGTPIAVRLVLEALSELGHTVDVLTFPIGSDPCIPGVHIHRPGNPFGIRSVPVGFSVRKILLDISLARRLGQLLQVRRYTYVHAVEEAAFLAAMFARRNGVPVLYDMQSSLPEQLAQRPMFRLPGIRPWLGRCERWLLDRVDLIVGSTGLADHVSAIGPSAVFREWTFPPSFAVTPPAETARLREGLEIPSSAPVVLYCGTFEAYQGLHLLLQSVALVRRAIPNVVFVLLGADGRLGETLTREASRADLRDGVRVVQRQPREHVGGYLSMADVVVSPRTSGQNIPLKIFDYLVAGKPIVATSIPAHSAVLDETRAALVERSAAALANGIQRVLQDQAYANRLATAARAYARKHLGWDTFVAKMDDMSRYMADLNRAAQRVNHTHLDRAA